MEIYAMSAREWASDWATHAPEHLLNIMTD